jgi:hypothetical protein
MKVQINMFHWFRSKKFFFRSVSNLLKIGICEHLVAKIWVPKVQRKIGLDQKARLKPSKRKIQIWLLRDFAVDMWKFDILPVVLWNSWPPGAWKSKSLDILLVQFFLTKSFLNFWKKKKLIKFRWNNENLKFCSKILQYLENCLLKFLKFFFLDSCFANVLFQKLILEKRYLCNSLNQYCKVYWVFVWKDP